MREKLIKIAQRLKKKSDSTMDASVGLALKYISSTIFEELEVHSCRYCNEVFPTAMEKESHVRTIHGIS